MLLQYWSDSSLIFSRKLQQQQQNETRYWHERKKFNLVYPGSENLHAEENRKRYYVYDQQETNRIVSTSY